jgi:FAD binding domain
MIAIETADTLRERFTGEAILPGQPAYDTARRVFNGAFDRHPALIARCACTADVVAAVDIARERELLVAVRGGGHSLSGLSTCDDGIVIDLSGLKSIAVDPQAQIARRWRCRVGRVRRGDAGPWAAHARRPRHDHRYCRVHARRRLRSDILQIRAGLRQPARGRGRPRRRHGRPRQRTRAPRPLLGAPWRRGNFGIVTEFEFRLHPLGPTVLAGLMMFPIHRARDVMRGWRDCADAAPDELSTACVAVTAPPEPFVPPELQGQPVVAVAAMYVGDPDRGIDVLQPLKDLAPAVDLVGPTP